MGASVGGGLRRLGLFSRSEQRRDICGESRDLFDLVGHRPHVHALHARLLEGIEFGGHLLGAANR